jgi:D-alanyl-D-alanine carboxypeptidase
MKLQATALSLVALVAFACADDRSVEPELPAQGGPALDVDITKPFYVVPTAAAEPAGTDGVDSGRQAAAEPVALQPAPWAAAPVLNAGAPIPWVDARAVVVVDEASGAVLLEKDSDQPLPPASLTKIATAVVALEQGNLDDWVEVNVDSREMKRSSLMGLLPGDWFQLRDLLYGLMLPSGNDAALAIGRAVAGGDSAFVREMNDLAGRLGLTETHFSNAHGLSARGHATSAHDLALLSRYAMTVPGFAEIVSTRYYTARGSREIPMGNQNGLLGTYEGADGIKVGFTYRAGKTRVASAIRDGHRVYVVVLNAPESLDDSKLLLDWALENHTWP